MRKYYQQAEVTYAKKTGGRRTRNSGAGLSQKGDVFVDDDTVMTELKSTKSQSGYITVKADDIRKCKRQAVFQGKEPRFVVAFGPDIWRYYRFDRSPGADVPNGTITVEHTVRLHEEQLIHGLPPGMVIDGELWLLIRE